MDAGRWRRLGCIGSIAGSASWAVSHTALPALLPLADGEWALFASARDAEGRARIGRARLRMEPAARIVDDPLEQVLSTGELGAFDDRGVTMSCVVQAGTTQYLFYTGWMLGVTVPFYLGVGLAISEDGGRTFHRASRAPVLDRCDTDPFLTASPFVLVESGRWRMWYVSGTGWAPTDGRPRHYYHIRYAESPDGLQWTRQSGACIDYRSRDEYAFGRPCVRYEHGTYRMWYSYRGARYRIGYAESTDGIGWTRHDDHRGLDASGAGWDSEMVTYPWVFDWSGATYMLYNGNGYGRTGIGLAVWETAAGIRTAVDA